MTVDRSGDANYCDLSINVASTDNITEGGIFTSASDENADIPGLQRAFTVTTSCTGDNLFVRLYAGEGADPNQYGPALVTNNSGTVVGENTVFTSELTLVDGIWNVCVDLGDEGSERKGTACYTVAAASIVDATAIDFEREFPRQQQLRER